MNIEDFEFYSFRGGVKKRYFLIHKPTGFEASINFASGQRGDNTYLYIDYLEAENDIDISEKELEEMEIFLTNHIENIIQAKEI